MANANFSLDHFYTGHFIDQPEAPRVLSRSANVTNETASAVMDRSSLPPLQAGNGISWALIRGTKQLPFIFAQAQVIQETIAVSHYILMPLDILRTLGGKLKVLQPLIQEVLPHPRDLRRQQPLEPLALVIPDEDDSAEQTDAMLTLMDIVNNRLDSIEKLLAAIVQGVQIIVTHAPQDLNQRLDFIMGLLAMLPPSVRFAVTFTTYSESTTDLDVQIRFLDQGDPAPETLVFNWETNELSGVFPEDEYSRFVISQLRLDTSLVIERTRALTPAAGWRMRQSDRLGDALAYASHRAALDTALLNHQPGDKDEVARILENDPTLSDNLRTVYAEHLLNLSLAMNDFDSVNQMAPHIWKNEGLSQVTLDRLSDTLSPTTALPIYRLILRVLSADPANEMEYTRWTTLAHRAALLLVTDLARAQNTDTLVPALVELANAPHAIHIERVAGRLVELAVPLATSDREIAKAAFLMAALHLNDTTFQRLMTLEPFVKQLPQPVSDVMPYLLNHTDAVAPSGTLMRAVNAFNAESQSVLLIRLAEMAREASRVDLFDSDIYDRLLNLATNNSDAATTERLRMVSQRWPEQQLLLLNEQAASRLLQLRLALGEYQDLASQMIQQSAVFYLGDRQIDYIEMVEQVFANTPISSSQAAAAISQIEAAGIRSAPLVMAGLGTLQNRIPNTELDQTAHHLLDILAAEPLLFSVVKTPSLMQIVHYYLGQRRVHDAGHAAGLLASGVIAHAEDAQTAQQSVIEMYRLLAARAETRPLAAEVLRIYVREAGDLDARTAIATFARQLGGTLRGPLEAVYFVREITAGQSLQEYAQAVKTTTDFLQDVASSYGDRDYPTLESLNAQMGTMKGGTFSREERRAITRTLIDSARGLMGLYERQRSARSAAPDKLLSAVTDPNSVMDAVWVIAGYFSEGRRHDLRLKTTLPNPLTERTRPYLYQEVLAMNSVIVGLAKIGQPGASFQMRASDLRDALASLKLELSETDQQEITRILSVDLQRLALLIDHIGSRGDPRALEPQGLGERLDSGRHRPKTALEFLRYLYGYYSARG